MSETSPLTILVVEDEPIKETEIVSIIEDHFTALAPKIIKVATINLAETALDDFKIDLLILDVSMNISKGSLGPRRGGHANLGGLDIVERMFLLKAEIPTVIVSGFDHFQGKQRKTSEFELIDLSAVEQRARKFLDGFLIGCVKYGDDNWEAVLKAFLGKFKR